MTYSSRTYSAKTHSNRTIVNERLFQFIVGGFGCTHNEPDNNNGRKSYRDYLLEVTSDSMGFDPDIVLNGGDCFSSQNPTELATHAAEGAEIASQRNAVPAMPVSHQYGITGNHCSGAGNYDCYNRYVDDFGNNTAYSGVINSARPFPITGEENKHYSFQTGNVLWLMLYDRNDGNAPCGRSDATGGHPSGSILEETYDWWESMVLANQDKVIITCHHNLLKDTTIATGDNEGVNGGYHGVSGQPIASGRLENIIIDIDQNQYEDEQTRIQDFLNTHQGAVSLWLGWHTHFSLNRTTQETYNGRGWNIFKWGTHHVSCGGVTRHHGTSKTPNSKALIFTHGSNILRVQNVNHGGYFSTGLDEYNYIDITLPHAFQHPEL